MSDWPTRSWGELASLEYGRALRGYKETDNQYRVFGTNGPIGWHEAPLFPPGVIIGRKGAYRGIHYSSGPCWVIDTAYYLRIRDLDVVDPRWAYYQLRTVDLNSIDSGSAIPSTSRDAFDAIPVRLAPIAVQRRVVAVLDAINELIENNRRRIALLERLAQAIYREWFVHFRYPGHEHDELIDSSLGPIPAGWEIRALAEICSINREQRKPTPDEAVVYIDISSLGDRSVVPPSPFSGSEAPGRARRVLADGDIVWSMVRPERRAHALLVRVDSDWIASTGLAVITPRVVAGSFLFESVSQQSFSDYLVGKEGGSAYPAVKPIDFGEAPIVVPPASVVEAFDGAVAPMHRAVWALSQEQRRAADLRDLLLPKLVTGAIDVSHLDLDALLDGHAA